MECELHKIALEEKMIYNERDVAMVSPSLEYMLHCKKFPHHTPFYYSSNKLADNQELCNVKFCLQCDKELANMLISK